MSPEEKESLVRSIFPLPQFSIESNAQSYIYSTSTTAQFLAVNGTLDVGVRCGGSRGFFRTRVGCQEERRPYETVSNGVVVTQRRGNRRKNASLTETGPFSQQKRSAGKQCAFFPPYSLPFSLSPLCPSFFHSSTYFFDPRSNPRPCFLAFSRNPLDPACTRRCYCSNAWKTRRGFWKLNPRGDPSTSE